MYCVIFLAFYNLPAGQQKVYQTEYTFLLLNIYDANSPSGQSVLFVLSSTRPVVFHFVIFYFITVGGGGYAARLFLLFSFPCSADHERDWPPCKKVLLLVVFRVDNQCADCDKQQPHNNHATNVYPIGVVPV